MTPVERTTRSTVRLLLQAAGISCSAAEFETLVDQYLSLNDKIEGFYAPAYVDAEPLLTLKSETEAPRAGR